MAIYFRHAQIAQVERLLSCEATSGAGKTLLTSTQATALTSGLPPWFGGLSMARFSGDPRNYESAVVPGAAGVRPACLVAFSGREEERAIAVRAKAGICRAH